ncbi:MAG: histidine ammonia-lyase [Phycisphaerales bacterium]|nr:histidine ammonia-lyase [Phycisphaerales bacterium]
MTKTTQTSPPEAHHESLILRGQPLTIDEVVAVARHGRRVELAPQTAARLAHSRRALLELVSGGQAYYGVNTGFGSLSRTHVDDQVLGELQRNLVRSHASGIGSALPDEVVRAMMLTLAGSLARGISGVRPQLVELILAFLNAGIVPVVPEIGSVGASGDLAPLSHVALALIGEGPVRVNGAERRSSEVMAQQGLRPIELQAKEGLALINGTHLMCGRAALVYDDFERVFSAALLADAMSMDACRVSHRFLDPRVFEVRGHEGGRVVAARLRELLAGSEIVHSHAENDPRVQDPYSFRCSPGVLGSVWDLAQQVRGAIETELGAVSDNPLVFVENGVADIVSAGNFHGMPIALPMDTLALCACHVSGISERRLFHMLSVFDPESGLRPFLSPRPGLHSGYMVVQYAAAAACNELIGLCTPASVSNLPTCAEMEDYNSFGPRCVAKASRGVELMRSVVAAEILCAAQGLEAHLPLKSGARVEAARRLIRQHVEALDHDRPPAPDLREVENLIARGAFA